MCYNFRHRHLGGYIESHNVCVDSRVHLQIVLYNKKNVRLNIFIHNVSTLIPPHTHISFHIATNDLTRATQDCCKRYEGFW